jgi:hypothetical protein
LENGAEFFVPLITIHSPVFEKMKTPEKKRCIIDYVGKVLD